MKKNKIANVFRIFDQGKQVAHSSKNNCEFSVQTYNCFFEVQYRVYRFKNYLKILQILLSTAVVPNSFFRKLCSKYCFTCFTLTSYSQPISCPKAVCSVGLYFTSSHYLIHSLPGLGDDLKCHGRVLPWFTREPEAS